MYVPHSFTVTAALLIALSAAHAQTSGGAQGGSGGGASAGSAGAAGAQPLSSAAQSLRTPGSTTSMG
jgi:hypothetical protein